MRRTKSAPTTRPRKPGRRASVGAEIERPGAEVEIDSFRLPLPAQPRDRDTAANA